MHNQFTKTEQAIEALQDWIMAQDVGDNGRWLASMFEDLDEQLTEIRTCFNDSVHDDTTERVFDLLEIKHHVNDADLAHTANKFLVEPDMSDRQKVIDQLSPYVGIAIVE